jgi:hypothetical protein
VKAFAGFFLFAPESRFEGCALETENKVRLGLPRIIQRKENAPEFDYSSLYAKIGAGDPLLCGGRLAIRPILAWLTRVFYISHTQTQR